MLQFELRGELTSYAVAEILGASASQLYDWRMRYGSQIANTGMVTPGAELKRLHREIKQVRDERDFLQKATAAFPAWPVS